MTSVLAASLTWDPGLRAIVLVAVAVAVLGGSVVLLLTTNVGHRLGVLMGVTGVLVILAMLGMTWTLLGVGAKGRAPTWRIKEITSGNLYKAGIDPLHSLPLATNLPSAESLIRKYHLQKTFANQTRPPNLSDVADASPKAKAELEKKLGGWRLLGTSNKVASDASATASQYLTTDSTAPKFTSTQDFVVLGIFDKGGKPAPSEDRSFVHRVAHKIEDTALWIIGHNPTHYAVVQIRPAVPQVTQPGTQPPTAQPNPKAPVYTVTMVRDQGTLRLPGFSLMVFSLIGTAICLSALHRRDKRAMALRAAARTTRTAISAGG